MDAVALAAAVDQAAAGIRSALGAMGLLAPKTDRVVFAGVAAGEAVLADGRRVALPVEKGAVVYAPGKLAGVRTVRFARAPSGVRLE
jgi:hypothetical protein